MPGTAVTCETCCGSGMVAVGRWGSRPPRVKCGVCGGAGTVAARDPRPWVDETGGRHEHCGERFGYEPRAAVELIDWDALNPDEREEFTRPEGGGHYGGPFFRFQGLTYSLEHVDTWDEGGPGIFGDGVAFDIEDAGRVVWPYRLTNF